MLQFGGARVISADVGEIMQEVVLTTSDPFQFLLNVGIMSVCYMGMSYFCRTSNVNTYMYILLLYVNQIYSYSYNFTLQNVSY